MQASLARIAVEHPTRHVAGNATNDGALDASLGLHGRGQRNCEQADSGKDGFHDPSPSNKSNPGVQVAERLPFREEHPGRTPSSSCDEQRGITYNAAAAAMIVSRS